MDIARLGLEVDSTGVVRATNNLGRMEKQGRETEVATKGLTNASSLLSAALASVAASLTIGELIQYSDAYKLVQNQIRLTTDSQYTLLEVQGELLRISNDTATEIGSSAELYATLSRNTDGLNLSQSALLDVVESINKTFFITGKSSMEASGAIRQLSQAFAKGKLNGDEFVSVSEGAPEILRAIQKETGASKAELLDMAAAGELTAELLVKSLQNYKDELDSVANSVDLAFGSKLTIANNNITTFVGQLESSSGVVGSFGDGLVTLSENLDTLVDIATAVALIYGGRLAGSIAAATTATIASTVANLRYVPSITGVSAALGMQAKKATASTVATNALAVAATGAKRALAFLGGPVGLLAVAAGSLLLYGDNTDEAADKTEDFSAKLKELAGDIEGVEIARLNADIAEYERKLRAIKQEQSDSVSLIGLITGSSANEARELHIQATKVGAIIQKLKQQKEELSAKPTKDKSQNTSDASAGNEPDLGPVLRMPGADEIETIDLIAERYEELSAIAERLNDTLRTPQEIYQDEIELLNELRDTRKQGTDEGLISYEEYTRGVKQAQEKLDDSLEDSHNDMSKFAERAAENMQDAFADFLFDPFEDGLDGMLKGFLKTMQRMAANEAAKSIFGEIGDGGLAGVIGSLFSFDGGGYTGSGSRSGGVDGKGGFPAILHPQETVIDHTKSNSASMGVTIINQTSAPIGNAETRISNGQMQIIITEAVQQSRQAVANDMYRGGNDIANAIESNYSLERSTRR